MLYAAATESLFHTVCLILRYSQHVYRIISIDRMSVCYSWWFPSWFLLSVLYIEVVPKVYAPYWFATGLRYCCGCQILTSVVHVRYHGFLWCVRQNWMSAVRGLAYDEYRRLLCYGCQNAEARMARKIMFDHTRRQGSIDTWLHIGFMHGHICQEGIHQARSHLPCTT